MLKSIRVIISTGQGRLHLIQSAVFIKKHGALVSVITGWVPGRLFPNWLINFLGKITGRKDQLAHGMRKRSPEALKNNLSSNWLAEFFVQGLFILSKLRLIPRTDGAVLGWKAFGSLSKPFIKDADIFHVRSGAGAGGAIEIAKKRGMKIVVDHSIAHPDELTKQLTKAAERDKPVSNKFNTIGPNDSFWKLVLADCMKADVLLVNSAYVKWSFIEAGYPAQKIKVISLGINPEFTVKKQHYSSESGGIRLAFSGGFGNRKGAHIIFEALDHLRHRGITFEFDIVGSIGHGTLIPDWAKRESIRFHGHLPQSEMLPILLNSDIYIFPTYVEGAAQSVKEAMSIGLPVITTRQSGAPIVHQENGWFISDDDPDALGDAIITLGSDTALRERLGTHAARTIEEGHTWDRYGTEVLQLYQELIAERHHVDG